MPPKKGGGAALELAPRKVQEVQDAATPAAAAKALEGLVGLCAEEGGACALTGSGALEALATTSQESRTRSTSSRFSKQS